MSAALFLQGSHSGVAVGNGLPQPSLLPVLMVVGGEEGALACTGKRHPAKIKAEMERSD